MYIVDRIVDRIDRVDRNIYVFRLFI